MRFAFLAILLAALLMPGPAQAQTTGNLDFTLHKLESGVPGNTLLVIGGIQGDEPGGFNAASLLVSHYRITSGSVWVVPNLNFISIVNCSRGVYGDLNRKFSTLLESDPEFPVITKIKSIILEDAVDMVLNLHDGSGFYRPEYLDAMHSPQRWGQSVIIDQEHLDFWRPFSNLGSIARHVADETNLHLYDDHHAYFVKNTNTREGDVEMEKTLTFFAIQNGVPAFGLEASKNFPVPLRAYYLLTLLESYMDYLGIEYERTFDLTAEGVQEAINSNVALAFFDDRIYLNLEDVRDRLGYIPLPRGSEITFSVTNPLVTVLSAGDGYKVYYGNDLISNLHPEYFDYDFSIPGVSLTIDGEERFAHFGDIMPVSESFLVEPMDGYRVNVIGFAREGVSNESGIAITHPEIMERFSVDREGAMFRVEVYKDDRFCGMVLVDFLGRTAPDIPRHARIMSMSQ